MLQLENLTKKYWGTTAVNNVNLTIEKGEFFCLLGSSGCGKTTILRMIAGFERKTSGQILLNGHDISDDPPYRRDVNTVFQDFALFPHMNAFDNVAYGLRIKKIGKAEIQQRVQEALMLVGLGTYGGRMPDQLSGGQQQRVALARALVNRPRVLLLDEPMSALDAKIAAQTRVELMELQRRVGITFIYVTHNQTEALSLADRVAVMHNGVVEQCGKPSEIYERPQTKFVADFIGSMNFFEGKVMQNRGTSCELLLEGRWTVSLEQSLDLKEYQSVWFCLRPEQMKLALVDPKPHENGMRGTLRKKIYEGDLTLYLMELEGGRTLTVSLHNYLARHIRDFFEVGEEFTVLFNRSSGVVIPR
jgi:spermidine/putrescine transport system ATP-binding protein